MRRFAAVSSDATSMSRMRLRGTRQLRRPMNRMRTPRSWSSSRRRRMVSRLKLIRNFTSALGRRQFSVENAYTVTHSMPSSRAPSMHSNSASSPRRCPSVRLRPRSVAQRPLPSMTTARWRGMPSGSMPSASMALRSKRGVITDRTLPAGPRSPADPRATAPIPGSGAGRIGRRPRRRGPRGQVAGASRTTPHLRGARTP